MSERWARAALTAYRYAGAAAYPLVGPYVAWRASRGKEDRARRRERYGVAGRPRPEGPVIWIHAASVGDHHPVTFSPIQRVPLEGWLYFGDHGSCWRKESKGRILTGRSSQSALSSGEFIHDWRYGDLPG